MRHPPPDHKANKWSFEFDRIDEKMCAVMVSVAHVHRCQGTMRYVYGASLYQLVDAADPVLRRDWRQAAAEVLMIRLRDPAMAWPGRLPLLRRYDAAKVDDVLAELSAA